MLRERYPRYLTDWANLVGDEISPGIFLTNTRDLTQNIRSALIMWFSKTSIVLPIKQRN